MNRNGFVLMFLAAALSLPVYAQQTVTVQILGMVCPLCSRGLSKGFGEKEAVENVNVDMDKQRVTLVLKDGQELGDEEIKEVVENAGVNVRSIER